MEIALVQLDNCREDFKMEDKRAYDESDERSRAAEMELDGWFTVIITTGTAAGGG